MGFLLNFLPAIAFISLLGLAVIYLLARIQRRANSAPLHVNLTPLFPSRKHRYVTWGLQALFSVHLLRKAILGLWLPLEFDEKTSPLYLMNGSFWDALNPFNKSPFFNNINHIISNAATYASIHWFGLNEFSIRLPSLGFSLLFLGLLAFYTYRYFSLMGILLTYLALSTNETLIWYMHANKGYVSCLFFFLALITLCQRVAREKAEGSVWFLGTFAFCFVGLVLSHTFGGFSAYVILIALIAWLSFTASPVSKATLHLGHRLFLIGLAVLPLFVCLLVFHGFLMTRLANFFAPQPHPFLAPVANAFGVEMPGWFLVTSLALVLAVFPFSFRQNLLTKLSVNAWFVLVMGTVLFSLSRLLNVSFLYSRFFLPFVPAVLFIYVELLEQQKKKAAFLGGIALFLAAFFIAPLTNSEKVRSDLFAQDIPYHEFITEVRELASQRKITCMNFSGAPREVAWAKYLYFPHVPSEGPQCKTHFLLHFTKGLFDTAVYAVNASSEYSYRRLTGDPEKQILFEVSSKLPLAKTPQG